MYGIFFELSIALLKCGVVHRAEQFYCSHDAILFIIMCIQLPGENTN